MFRIFRKFLAEISGALIISVMVFGVFFTAMGCQGVMRIVGPLLVIAACFGLYYLTGFIAAKQDRK